MNFILSTFLLMSAPSIPDMGDGREIDKLPTKRICEFRKRLLQHYSQSKFYWCVGDKR